MDEKTCRTCGLTKPLSEFSKNLRSGPFEIWNLRSQCKACVHDAYVDRYSTPRRRKAMVRAARNWKKANPERHNELAREYRRRHPEKIIAQNRLNYAIRKGRVVRQPCEVCGTEERVHAHHVSYAPEDWYNVKWLCGVCHEIEHG